VCLHTGDMKPTTLHGFKSLMTHDAHFSLPKRRNAVEQNMSPRRITCWHLSHHVTTCAMTQCKQNVELLFILFGIIPGMDNHPSLWSYQTVKVFHFEWFFLHDLVNKARVTSLYKAHLWRAQKVRNSLGDPFLPCLTWHPSYQQLMA